MKGIITFPAPSSETARQCDERGGKGIAVPCDHADNDQVASLFDQIKREAGRLDILVNNAFTLSEDLLEPKGFWEKPLSNWEMMDVGVKSNFVASWHAAQIMVPQKSGLMINISGYAALTYTYGVLFGTSKTAVGRMNRDMGIELKPHGVSSIALVAGADPDRKGEGQSCQNGRKNDEHDHHAKGQLGRASGPGDRGAV